MMKSSIRLVVAVIALLSLTSQTFANELTPYGGLLVSKVRDRRVFVTCEKENLETKECEEFYLYTQATRQEDPFLKAIYKPKYLKFHKRRYAKERNAQMRTTILAGYLFGTATTALICGFGNNHVCPLFPLGVTLDLVKLPAMLAVHTALLPVMFYNKLDQRRLVNFLFKAKNRGKTKNISERRMRPLYTH